MQARDHGGDLDRAAARFGGAPEDWLDLSTGINRLPYPAPETPPRFLHALPRKTDVTACAEAARRAYAVAEAAAVLPLAGAQAAIQLLPRLRPPGRVRVLGPTYNEHAAAFAAEGWTVETVAAPEAFAGAEAAVVVNPNNPDGRETPPDALLALAARVGLLVVDESFGDVAPALSLAPFAGRSGLLVLRSLGKFYGLAGLRLGFAIGAPEAVARLAETAGPWAVSGPALHAGRAALSDGPWAAATRARLGREAERLDRLAARADWRLAGGTALFRLYETPDALAARDRLARARIWSRAFPWSPRLLRLGLPGPEAEWRRLEAALKDGP